MKAVWYKKDDDDAEELPRLTVVAEDREEWFMLQLYMELFRAGMVSFSVAKEVRK